MECEFSPAAVADIEEIGDYIARDNPTRSVKFCNEIIEYCFATAKSPNSGVLRDDLGDNIRMLIFGRYLIFYKIYKSHIRIERVLHSARNLIADFFH